MTATINRNTEKNGIEIFFDAIPSREIIDGLKAVGYRWHNVKKCWYAKASEETENAARIATEGAEATEATESTNTRENAQKRLAPLWERAQYAKGSGEDKCHAHTVGSRYKAGMANKEIAAEVKKHVSARFPECKFSASSAGYDSIRIEIKSGEFSKDSEELAAIRKYAEKYLDSYNYDDSDVMTDYFNTNFYGSVSVNYDYQQTETENTANTCEAFQKSKEEAEAAAREREKKEIAEQIERRKKEEAEYKRIEAENRAKVAEIEAAAVVIEYDPEIVRDVYAHEVRKASTIEEARKLIAEYSDEAPQLCRVSRAVILPAAWVDAFGSLLMYDYSFLSGQGGHGTDDARINSDLDFQNMTQAESDSIVWFNECTAIIESESGSIKFLVNPEGYNYARYVYILPENAAFTTPKIADVPESIQKDKERAVAVEDASTYIIENSNTITLENWKTSEEYREQMKKCVPVLDVDMIRQITVEPLKEWLYKEHSRRLSINAQSEILSEMKESGIITKRSKYSSCVRQQLTDIKQYIIDNGGEILVDRSEV